VTAKAKAKPAGRTHSVTHGNTRTTTTHSHGETTVTKSTKKGDHRTVVTTVRKGGKVVSTSTHRYLIVKAPKKTAAQKAASAKKAAASKKRGAPGLCAEGWWVTAGNDRLDTCVAVAVANSYLAVTGLRVPDWQVLALAGMRTIPGVLEALGVPYGPAGGLCGGVILGVAGEHAVTVHDGALVSWGAEHPLDGLGEIEEAWEVCWRG
jgi:hypothetical protein